MKFGRSFLLAALPSILTLSGCGSGSSEPTTKVAFSNGASLSIVSSGNGNYVIQGDNLIGVAGVNISLKYNPSSGSAPLVTQGDFATGMVFATNTSILGVIRIAGISNQPKSGSGAIAAILLPGDQNTLSFESVQLIDLSGKILN